MTIGVADKSCPEVARAVACSLAAIAATALGAFRTVCAVWISRRNVSGGGAA